MAQSKTGWNPRADTLALPEGRAKMPRSLQTLYCTVTVTVVVCVIVPETPVTVTV